jgi:geranylgeranyl pyrophosphate synthase
LLLEEIIGTEDVPEYISSDSSLEAEDATPEQRTSHQLRRRVRHMEHGLRDITARCQAERERRMALEALVGGKCFRPLLVFVLTSGFLATNTHSSVSDVSDRYNNLKAAWDSLVEAANHGHPSAFQVAVTVVLEQLKREQSKKKQRKD